MFKYNNRIVLCFLLLIVWIGVLTIEVKASSGTDTIYVELLDGKMIFDFEKPKIPEVYVISDEPESLAMEEIWQNLVSYYEPIIAGREFTRKQEGFTTTYHNFDIGRLIYSRYGFEFSLFTHKVFAEDNSLNLAYYPKINQYVEKAKDFIEIYCGGFRDDLKYVPRNVPRFIYFAQYIDGVRIDACGITVELYNETISYVGRGVRNFKKVKPIDPEDLLSPEMALLEVASELNEPSDRTRSKTYTDVELVYWWVEVNHTPTEYIIVPAWRFTGDSIFVLNALNGTQLGQWNDKFVMDEKIKKYYEGRIISK